MKMILLLCLFSVSLKVTSADFETNATLSSSSIQTIDVNRMSVDYIDEDEKVSNENYLDINTTNIGKIPGLLIKENGTMIYPNPIVNNNKSILVNTSHLYNNHTFDIFSLTANEHDKINEIKTHLINILKDSKFVVLLTISLLLLLFYKIVQYIYVIIQK